MPSFSAGKLQFQDQAGWLQYTLKHRSFFLVKHCIPANSPRLKKKKKRGEGVWEGDMDFYAHSSQSEARDETVDNLPLRNPLDSAKE